MKNLKGTRPDKNSRKWHKLPHFLSGSQKHTRTENHQGNQWGVLVLVPVLVVLAELALAALVGWVVQA